MILLQFIVVLLIETYATGLECDIIGSCVGVSIQSVFPDTTGKSMFSQQIINEWLI